ncbi:phosphotransferase family protein [Herbiconiux sp. L3-i23]|uniref:phosphotransferase family protein n=1 Tax=Herbiconiux sp. L3-i23 TaxID=2905871 RepID=UPI00206BDEF3|nr:phosphotransferase [Herbiconiux sp. L3-i23]BDI21801.1 hypothetical protein L3i23_05770 [Herbiconiux sp. L3-i23]
MRDWRASGLTGKQAALLGGWLTDPELLADLSWGVATTVLHFRSAGAHYIAKAGGSDNTHIGREITAYERYTSALADLGLAPRLVAADRDARVLLLDYLDGDLVDGTDSATAAEVHEQAGRLLRRLHAQEQRVDDGYEERATRKALADLDRPHRLTHSQADAARAMLHAARPRPVTSVPTHGDWQPRNWLIDASTVKAIDFGRFAFRPAHTDLCRLAAQQWRGRSDLEAAFLRGYGSDPRDPELWRIEMLRQAIGTAVWAHSAGDRAFEAQGLRMVSDAVSGK